MRYVSSFPPRLSVVGGREVKGVSSVRQIRSALVRNHPVSEIERYRRFESHQQPHHLGEQGGFERRAGYPEDRRKRNLRVTRQKMLVEFRSGRNRRRRNQRGSDYVDRIDEKA